MENGPVKEAGRLLLVKLSAATAIATRTNPALDSGQRNQNYKL